MQPDSPQAAISFASPEVLSTKTLLITDKTHLVSGTNELGYSVFAARYIPSESGEITNHEQFMTDIKIYSTDSGKTWNYNGNSYYWSPGAIHKFFAVYPCHDATDNTYDFGLSYSINDTEHALQVTGQHTEGSKTYICTGTNASGKNGCPDILFGVNKYSTPYSVGEDRGPIIFNLAHAMAAVSFKFKNISDIPVRSITTYAISGFMNAAEYVLLSDDGAVWSEGKTIVADHSFAVPGFIASNASPAIGRGQEYKTDGEYWYTALMIPQNFGKLPSSPYFTFTVTMENMAPKTYTINFQDYRMHTEAENAYSYLPGYHYVYTFNVNANNMTCDVDIVPWIDDDPIHLN